MPRSADRREQAQSREDGMHFARIATASFDALSGIPVSTEVKLFPLPQKETGEIVGAPSIKVSGMIGTQPKEASFRVFSALDCEFELPQAKIYVNLNPASMQKNSTAFDLAIATAILRADGQLRGDAFDDAIIIGELSLDGRVNHVTGALLAALLAKQQGYARLIVPAEDYEEASAINALFPEKTLRIIPVSRLSDMADPGKIHRESKPVFRRELTIFERPRWSFAEIKGHESAKRALEVAIAGNHNVLMFGPKGSGKTILAEAVEQILPPLSDEELVDALLIRSLLNRFDPAILKTRQRPFVTPSQTDSPEAVIGGDSPGLLSLAHHGVLFLDEINKINARVLTALYNPLSEGVVEVSRVHQLSKKYPAKISLIASMNECPCGKLGSGDACSCSATDIVRHRKKIDTPLLDRFDMDLHVGQVPYETLDNSRVGEPNEVMRERVLAARQLQEERYKNEPAIRTNADITTTTQLLRYCSLDKSAQQELRRSGAQKKMSARVYHKMLKIARTIADLEGSERITIGHVAEALSWRQTWGEEEHV